jgi:hypothetical protein
MQAFMSSLTLKQEHEFIASLPSREVLNSSASWHNASTNNQLYTHFVTFDCAIGQCYKANRSTKSGKQ